MLVAQRTQRTRSALIAGATLRRMGMDVRSADLSGRNGLALKLFFDVVRDVLCPLWLLVFDKVRDFAVPRPRLAVHYTRVETVPSGARVPLGVGVRPVVVPVGSDPEQLALDMPLGELAQLIFRKAILLPGRVVKPGFLERPVLQDEAVATPC